MENLFAALSLFGPVSIIIALLVLALLSQRLGAVTRHSPLYRWFYVSVALVAISLGWRLLGMIAPEQFNHDAQSALVYDAPLAVGLLIAVVVAWRYWSWLLSERGRGT
ncbi:MAG: hypothetical protein ABI947_03805 [Chloroflexota bacterium]